MTKIHVLVTGIGGGGNGEQILKALRLATDLDLFVVGTDVSEYTAGKRFVDELCILPAATHPNYGETLGCLIKKCNAKFLFSGSEPELKYISENREKFAQLGVSMYFNTKELVALCMNKYTTYRKLDELKIPQPRYLKIDSIEDLNKVDFFPVVLKPNTSSGGSNHVYIARDSEEVLMLGQYLLKLKVDVIAQEYVGGPDAEYTIGVNSDPEGNLVGSIAIKRVIGNAVSTRLRVPSLDGQRTHVISSGFSQGIVCHVPELQEQAEKIAKGLDSRGPINVQCRCVDGKLQLMEINPRLSGTTSLRAAAGYNEPAMFIRNIVHGTPWSTYYRDTVLLRGLEEVEIADSPAQRPRSFQCESEPRSEQPNGCRAPAEKAMYRY